MAMSINKKPALDDHWNQDLPSRNVCIDEGIGPWQGKKKGVCVFILGKPHPNGIKLYILADENGYVYDFWIYRGTQKTIPCHGRLILWYVVDGR